MHARSKQAAAVMDSGFFMRRLCGMMHELSILDPRDLGVKGSVHMHTPYGENVRITEIPKEWFGRVDS